MVPFALLIWLGIHTGNWWVAGGIFLGAWALNLVGSAVRRRRGQRSK